MQLSITPSHAACGARVEGVDLSQDLASETVAALRAAWLEHHVLAFVDQAMDDDDLERFTQYFGPFGVERRAAETAPVFAEAWHTDWSFQVRPPIGTCLLGLTIPPTGGDTLFANQHAALDAMPAALRKRIEGRVAIHSAKR